MAVCSASCTQLPPSINENKCGIFTRSGGISRIVYASNSINFDNIYDLSEWCNLVITGQIVVTNPVIGQKPKGSATKKRLSSCQSESVIGFERTVTFQDYNSDDTYLDYDFYNKISEDTTLYKVGFLTCDGLFYGFVDNFVLEVDLIIEDNNLGSTYWDGIISWTKFESLKPLKIPNLLNTLQGNCLTTPNYNPCYQIEIENCNGTNDLICDGPIEMIVPTNINAHYQWYFQPIGGGPFTAIPGATGSSYQATQPGTYYVIYTIDGCNTIFQTKDYTLGDNTPTFDIPPVDFISPPVSPAVITINANPTTDIEYAVIVNGAQTVWQDSPIFFNIAAGVHQALIRDKITGCISSVYFTVEQGNGQFPILPMDLNVKESCENAQITSLEPGLTNYDFYFEGTTSWSPYFGVPTLVQSGPSPVFSTLPGWGPGIITVTGTLGPLIYQSAPTPVAIFVPPPFLLNLSVGSGPGFTDVTFVTPGDLYSYILSIDASAYVEYIITDNITTTVYANQFNNENFVNVPDGDYTFERSINFPSLNQNCNSFISAVLPNGQSQLPSLTLETLNKDCSSYTFEAFVDTYTTYNFYVKGLNVWSPYAPVETLLQSGPSNIFVLTGDAEIRCEATNDNINFAYSATTVVNGVIIPFYTIGSSVVGLGLADVTFTIPASFITYISGLGYDLLYEIISLPGNSLYASQLNNGLFTNVPDGQYFFRVSIPQIQPTCYQGFQASLIDGINFVFDFSSSLRYVCRTGSTNFQIASYPLAVYNFYYHQAPELPGIQWTSAPIGPFVLAQGGPVNSYNLFYTNEAYCEVYAGILNTLVYTSPIVQLRTGYLPPTNVGPAVTIIGPGAANANPNTDFLTYYTSYPDPVLVEWSVQDMLNNILIPYQLSNFFTGISSGNRKMVARVTIGDPMNPILVCLNDSYAFQMP